MRINEIFYSLQGESSYAGYPFIFVRLSGCNLRCSYCDTTYAFEEGQEYPVSQVVAQVQSYGRCPVLITGGEPLLQGEVYSLMKLLLDAGYKVLLETSGSLSVENVDSRIVKILDIKCPSSGESVANLWSNLLYLDAKDEVKFVIGTREDYQYARQVCDRYRLQDRCQVLFSPVFGVLAARELADWILKDRLPVRLQIQLHKHLWPGKESGY
jgi:7-carboxy-7-deazaguanine synthase